MFSSLSNGITSFNQQVQQQMERNREEAMRQHRENMRQHHERVRLAQEHAAASGNVNAGDGNNATADGDGRPRWRTQTVHGPNSSTWSFSFGTMPPSAQNVHRNFLAPGDPPRADSPFDSFDNSPFAQFMAPLAQIHALQQERQQQQEGTPGGGVPTQAWGDLAQLLAQALGHVPGTAAGDYASAEQFDNLVTELMNRNPTSNVRPAPESLIAALPRRTLTDDGDKRLKDDCSICQDEYKVGDELMELGCKHAYHATCVAEWLKVNAACPICRKVVEPPSQQRQPPPTDTQQLEQEPLD